MRCLRGDTPRGLRCGDAEHNQESADRSLHHRYLLRRPSRGNDLHRLRDMHHTVCGGKYGTDRQRLRVLIDSRSRNRLGVIFQEGQFNDDDPDRYRVDVRVHRFHHIHQVQRRGGGPPGDLRMEPRNPQFHQLGLSGADGRHVCRHNPDHGGPGEQDKHHRIR